MSKSVWDAYQRTGLRRPSEVFWIFKYILMMYHTDQRWVLHEDSYQYSMQTYTFPGFNISYAILKEQLQLQTVKKDQKMGSEHECQKGKESAIIRLLCYYSYRSVWIDVGQLESPFNGSF